MKASRPYRSSRSFRTALEARLNQIARDQHIDPTRLWRQVAFDRLLARLFAEEDPPWLLKGGYALELRLAGRARSTKDVDLSLIRLPGSFEQEAPSVSAIREYLQEVLELDLADWFVFNVGASTASNLRTDPFGGARYGIEARLDHRRFTTFHIDIGIGMPWFPRLNGLPETSYWILPV